MVDKMSAPVLLAALGGMSIFVAIEAAWLYSRVLPSGYRHRIDSRIVRVFLLALYAIGLPYFALMSGLLPPRFLGLRGWDALASAFSPQPIAKFIPNFLLGTGNALYLWLPDFGPLLTTVGILGGTFIVFLMLFRRNKPLSAATGQPSAFLTLFDVVHSGFYRAIFWRLLGNLYLATLGGVVILALEWIAVARAGQFSPDDTKRLTLRFGLTLISGIAFIFAPNLWLVGIVHWALWWAVFLSAQLWHSPNYQWPAKQSVD